MRLCKTTPRFEFLKGATVWSRNIFQRLARFGFLNAKMQNLSNVYLFWVLFLFFLLLMFWTILIAQNFRTEILGAQFFLTFRKSELGYVTTAAMKAIMNIKPTKDYFLYILFILNVTFYLTMCKLTNSLCLLRKPFLLGWISISFS